MPRPISDEELQLKKRARRRLVGAIVLVTAVAVILPMVLDSEPRPVTQNVEIQIPSTEGEFKPKSGNPAGSAAKSEPPAAPGAPSKAAPVASAPSKGAPGTQSLTTAPLSGMPPAPAAAPKGASKAETPAMTADAKAAADDANAPKAKDDARTAAAKDAAAKAATRDGAGASGAYVVQVAALADEARVKQLQKQMTAAGIKTYTEAITTKGGEVTRVRAGPYATKEAAETARSQLRRAGLDGTVVAR